MRSLHGVKSEIFTWYWV